MFARFGQDADQQINDFIGAVAHGYPARVHPVQSGQGLDQTRIAALGIAEQKRRRTASWARGEAPNGFSLLAILMTWERPYFCWISAMESPGT